MAFEGKPMAFVAGDVVQLTNKRFGLNYTDGRTFQTQHLGTVTFKVVAVTVEKFVLKVTGVVNASGDEEASLNIEDLRDHVLGHDFAGRFTKVHQ